MPRIEDGEIVFDVRLDGSDGKTELVRATTRVPGVIIVPFFGLGEETISAARGEVVRWTNGRRHFMESLHARLAVERRSQAIRSEIRRLPGAPEGNGAEGVSPEQADAACTLCGGIGEVNRVVARADGQPSWAFLPKTEWTPAKHNPTLVPCPACRRANYESHVERDISATGLAGDLERLGAVVSGRTATIRERLKGSAPAVSEPTPKPRGDPRK